MKSPGDQSALAAIVGLLETQARQGLKKGCPGYPVQERSILSAYMRSFDMAGAFNPTKPRLVIGLKYIAFPQPAVLPYQWGWHMVIDTLFMELSNHAQFVEQAEKVVYGIGYDMGRMSFRIARARERRGLEPIPKITRAGTYVPPPVRPANHPSQD